VAQGEEKHPTFYQYRHEDKAFHLDYCFVPAGWRVKSVQVGRWSDWHRHSDHCPLTVEIAF
jgi:endonuclease/exonuclease/phosphatase family metal-dependent hydrolase